MKRRRSYDTNAPSLGGNTSISSDAEHFSLTSMISACIDPPDGTTNSNPTSTNTTNASTATVANPRKQRVPTAKTTAVPTINTPQNTAQVSTTATTTTTTATPSNTTASPNVNSSVLFLSHAELAARGAMVELPAGCIWTANGILVRVAIAASAGRSIVPSVRPPPSRPPTAQTAPTLAQLQSSHLQMLQMLHVQQQQQQQLQVRLGLQAPPVALSIPTQNVPSTSTMQSMMTTTNDSTLKNPVSSLNFASSSSIHDQKNKISDDAHTLAHMHVASISSDTQKDTTTVENPTINQLQNIAITSNRNKYENTTPSIPTMSTLSSNSDNIAPSTSTDGPNLVTEELPTQPIFRATPRPVFSISSAPGI